MNFRRVALLAALVPFSTVAAQTGRDLYAPAVLLLPGGTRTLAMGNIGVAGRDDDVLFYNPSQLAIARGLSASIERLSSTSATGSLSSVTRFSTGGVAVGMRMVDYEAPADFFPVNRSTMLDAGAVTGTSVEAAIGVGLVIKGLRVGGTAKYVEDNVPSIRASRGAFDFGVSKDMLRTTFALAVQNLGSRVSVPCSIASGGTGLDCIPPPGFGPFPREFTSVGLPFRGHARRRAITAARCLRFCRHRRGIRSAKRLLAFPLGVRSWIQLAGWIQHRAPRRRAPASAR